MARKSFISGAMILMLAGLAVRVMGFIYRIYLSNLIGSEGIGLFQLISPVYSLIILTLTSGVSIAVSKMVAREMALRHTGNLKRITSCALMLVVGASLLVSAFIFFFARYISDVLLKDPRTYYSLVILIPCIPVISASSVLKGYFYGMQEVVPTALSQIVEQVVRIVLVMTMAAYFFNLGLEYACALATVGMAIGEISNLTVLYVFYKFKKGKIPANLSSTGILRKRKIFSELLKISLPVSANRFITSIMASFEYILIPRRLLASGLDYQSSMEMYGKLTGMAMPLIFFPSLVTSSLAITLVPAISEAVSLKNYKTVNHRISKSIQIACILGFMFTALFLSYPNEIGNMLYKRENIGDLLYMLAFTCIFLYLQQTLVGILNGLGKQGISLRNSMMGNVLRIGFVYFLIPVYGLKAYIWGIISSSILVCILDLYQVIRTTGMAMDFRNWMIKPGLVAILLYGIRKYIYAFAEIFISTPTIVTVFTIMMYGMITIFFLTWVKALDIGEVLSMAGIKRHRKIKKYLE